MGYKSQLSTFDKERGDVVSIIKEDVARLYAGGIDIMGPIIWRFFEWVLGGPDEPMVDPRDNMILAGLKEHQRANAARHYARLLSQQEKGQASAKARNTRGQPRSTVDAREVKESESEDRAQSDISSLRDHLSSTATPSPSGGGGPSSFHPQITELRFIKSIDKDGTEHYYPDATTYEHFLDEPVQTIFDHLQEDDEDLARNTYRKFLRIMGIDAFARIVWPELSKRCNLYNSCDRCLTKAERALDSKEQLTLKATADIYRNQADDITGRTIVARLKEKCLAMGIETIAPPPPIKH